MRIQVLLATALMSIAICAAPALAVGPGTVHECGTFLSYAPPSATASGVLRVGAITYAAAWMGSTGPAGSTPHTFDQVVANGVAAGSQVCVDGTMVLSQTEGNLLTDFIVSSAPSQLPGTSTDDRDRDIPLALLLGCGVIAAAAMPDRQRALSLLNPLSRSRR